MVAVGSPDRTGAVPVRVREGAAERPGGADAAPGGFKVVIAGADDLRVRRALRLAAPLALAAAALVAVPGGAAGASSTAVPGSARGASATVPQPAELTRLQTELEQVTLRAVELADALDAAAAKDGGLRVELDRLGEQQDAAQARVAARARQAYIAAGRDPMADLIGGLAAGSLRPLADAELARRGAAAAVRAERELVEAAAQESEATRLLQERAAAFRAALRTEAEQVLATQDAARALLAQAERLLAEQEARAATKKAQAVALAANRVRLTSARAMLDGVSASVTKALTPAQTRRSQTAAAREAPVLALVEAAGAGYPQGWAPSGQVLSGQASWYGPGFVGNPTASGTPYDPERMTCAHKSLPLGTVLRISRGPLAISCLVNDRGPYVGARILDLSRAGSRALGFDGVAQVTAEILAPV